MSKTFISTYYSESAL